MSEKKGFERHTYVTTMDEVRRGSLRYVDAIVKVLEKIKDGSDPIIIGKEMVFIGYALGVIAGKCSDFCVEGFTVLLNGIKLSLTGESREEEIHSAIWDKEGNLHTSDESFKVVKEGGES